MAVQIGSCSSIFRPSSCRDSSKIGRCGMRFVCGQRNVVPLFYGDKGGPNSRQIFHINRLVLSYSSSKEINPNSPQEGLYLNPSTNELLEDFSLHPVTQKAEGKPGFVSFHRAPYKMKKDGNGNGNGNGKVYDMLWFLGPTVLVSFLVWPSLFLRKILSLVFEDSLLTDFLILFFAEALFYAGVLFFLFLTDLAWRRHRTTLSSPPPPKLPTLPKAPRYFQILSVVMKVLNLIIPLVTMGLVWPWTGPAASATLAPYLVGLVVQFSVEQFARRKNSPSWPVIPIIFQVYRLHQLNRAAQLVTALAYSVRSAEATAQTSAITNSLGTLLITLQILGVICVWSLSSFVMRFLPSTSQNGS